MQSLKIWPTVDNICPTDKQSWLAFHKSLNIMPPNGGESV